ncbi:MAG: hypothetical protein WAM08_07630, partial [Candidatus Acidiferrales bacterium]
MKSPAHSKVLSEKLLTELAQLKDDAGRRTFLSRHKHLVRTASVERLAREVVEKVRVDMKLALRLAEAAVLIARRLRRKESLALALRAKANALYGGGHNREAVEHHDQAFKLYEALGILKEAARTLSSSV